MLSVTGVDKGDIVPIVISIVYGSRVLPQKPSSLGPTMPRTCCSITSSNSASQNQPLHRRGQGRHSSHYYIYRLRLKGFDPETDLEYRAHEVPQCQELIEAYRAQTQLDKITPLLATSGSTSHRKEAIPSEAISQRKTAVPSRANPLLVSTKQI